MAKSLQTSIVFNGVDRVSQVVAGIHRSVSGLANNMSNMSGRLNAAGMNLTAAVSLPAAALVKSSIDSAKQTDSALKDLGYASDLSGTGLDNMRKQLDTAAEKLGRAKADMYGAASDALKSGVKNEDIAPFMDLATKFSTASGMVFNEASAGLAKVQQALNLNNTELAKAADVMAGIDKETSASMGQLIEFTKYAAGFSQSYKLGVPWLESYGAALLSVGVDASTASNALKKFESAVTAGAGVSKNQKSAFKILGIDPVKLAKKGATDIEAANEILLDALAKVPDDKRNDVLSKLVGENYDDTIATLLAQNEKRKEVLRKSNQGMFSGALENAFGTQSQKLDFKLGNLSAAFKDLRAAMGADMVAPLGKLSDKLTAMTRSLEKNPEALHRFTRALMGAVVVGPAVLALGALTGALANITRVAAFAATPLVMVTRAASLMGVALYGSARAAMAARAGLLALTVPLVAVPAALAAIGIAAIGIYKGWDQIKAAFAGVNWEKMALFAKGFGKALMDLDFGKMGAMLKGMWREVEPLVSAIGKAITDQFSKVSKWLDENVPGWKKFREGIESAVKSVGGFIDSLVNLANTTAMKQAQKAIGDFLGSVGGFVLSQSGKALESLASILERSAKAIDDLTKSGDLGKFFADLPMPVKAFSAALGMLAIKKTSDMLSSLSFTVRNLGADMMGTGSKTSKMFNLLKNPGFVGPMTYALTDTLNKFDWFKNMMGGEVDAFSAALTASFAAMAIDIGASLVKAFAGTKIGSAAGAAVGAAYSTALKGAMMLADAVAAAWGAVKSVAARAAGALAGAAYAVGAAIAEALAPVVSAAWGGLKVAAAAIAGALAGTAYAEAAAVAQALGASVSAAWAGLSTVAATTAGSAFGSAFILGAGAIIAAGLAAAIAAGVMAALQQIDPSGNLWGMTSGIDNWVREKGGLAPRDGGITPGELWQAGSNWWNGVTVPEGAKPPTMTVPRLNVPANDNADLSNSAIAQFQKDLAELRAQIGQNSPAGNTQEQVSQAILSQSVALERVAVAAERAAQASEQTTAAVNGTTSAVRDGNAILATLPGAFGSLAGALGAKIRAANQTAGNKVNSNSMTSPTTLGHR